MLKITTESQIYSSFDGDSTNVHETYTMGSARWWGGVKGRQGSIFHGSVKYQHYAANSMQTVWKERYGQDTRNMGWTLSGNFQKHSGEIPN